MPGFGKSSHIFCAATIQAFLIDDPLWFAYNPLIKIKGARVYEVANYN